MEEMNHRDELNHYKRHIDIREYLTSVGYVSDKERDTPRYRAFSNEVTQDKVYVPINKAYANPNFYVNQHDSQDKGTVVNFVMTRQQKDLNEARQTLREYLGQGYMPSPEKRIDSEKNTDAEEVAKKKRQDFVVQRITQGESGVNEVYLQKRLLLHDTRNHVAFQEVVKLNEAPDARFVAFPLKDELGNVSGLAMKSPTKERFLGNRDGAWVSSPTRSDQAIDKAIITEDPVDAMSYHQLRGNRSQENVVYISPAGNPSVNQLSVIKEHIILIDPKSVVLANDNDLPGKEYDRKYQQTLKDIGIPVQVEKSTFKDWNADLFAQQVYRSRLLDRSNPHPERLADPEKIRAPKEVEKIIQDRDKKQYPSLSDDPSLAKYYVKRTVDDKQVEYSLSEVAYINKDRKLGEVLGVDVDTGYVTAQRDKIALLSVSAQQGSEKVKLERDPVAIRARIVDTRDKIQEGRSMAQDTKQYVKKVSAQITQPSISESTHDKSIPSVGAQRSVSQQPVNPASTTSQDAEYNQVKQQYNQRIDVLQAELKQQPGTDRALGLLDYYKKYPHLKSTEIDNYLSAEEIIKSHQQGKSRSIGNQQERGL